MHHRSRRALRQRVGDEGVTVPAFTEQRDEQVARRQGPRVDRHARRRRTARTTCRRSPRPAPRGVHRLMRPSPQPDSADGARMTRHRRTEHRAADRLSLLVALAGHHQHVARRQTRSAPPRSPSPGRRSPAHPGTRRGSRHGSTAGSSPRGLSSVTIATSASRAAASPISGRLPRSRSPPAPNTTCSRPCVCGRSAVSSRSSASGVWA